MYYSLLREKNGAIRKVNAAEVQVDTEYSYSLGLRRNSDVGSSGDQSTNCPVSAKGIRREETMLLCRFVQVLQRDIS